MAMMAMVRGAASAPALPVKLGQNTRQTAMRIPRYVPATVSAFAGRAGQPSRANDVPRVTALTRAVDVFEVVFGPAHACSSQCSLERVTSGLVLAEAKSGRVNG